MTSLVTGASGFLGSHLVDHLLARGDNVVAFQRRPGTGQERLRVVEGDVLDEKLLHGIIREHAPGEIYHLAAQSHPGQSWRQPWQTHQINFYGTLNVLEAARTAENKPRVVVASSSSIYAQSPGGTPIREDAPCHPVSPYGISKLAADHLARLYAQRHGLFVIRVRPFFLIGPRKTGDVCSDWARNIAAIEGGRADALTVGNMDVVRDFVPVADGVEALALLAAEGRAGDAYNIATGSGWRLTELLKAMTSLATTRIEVRVDPAKIRPVDEQVKVGDSSKLQALGWRPKHSVEQALTDILAHWREAA